MIHKVRIQTIIIAFRKHMREMSVK